MARRETNVILCKCVYTRSARDNLFGIRIEKIQGDWMRTWTFKIDEDKARNEGFDKENISGSFGPTDKYPGCPYCGSLGIAQCGGCGTISCIDPNREEKLGHVDFYDNQVVIIRNCPNCGEEAEYVLATGDFDMKGGGY